MTAATIMPFELQNPQQTARLTCKSRQLRNTQPV